MSTIPEHTEDHRHVFRLYFLLIYFVVVAVLSVFATFISSNQSGEILFAIAAVLSYPAVYLAIPALATKISLSALRPDSGKPRWRVNICYLTAWFTTSCVLVILFADFNLYRLYDYHFNRFVWNLITTPGGIQSLGASLATQLTFSAEIAAIFIANALALKLIKTWFIQRKAPRFSAKKFTFAVAILVTILIAEEGVCAYIQYVGNADYYRVIAVVPFHLESKASRLFKRLGIKHKKYKNVHFVKGRMAYPQAPITCITPQKLPNIVWLTAESFRWDLLDPEITPNLWKFSHKCNNFTHHYSGGNRTRMGMLSMFYGLYPPYWYKLQQEKIRPVLMNQIVKDNYQLSLNTSQSFTYPELNDTLFTAIPASCKQELQQGPPWKRDHQNISDIISFIKERDQSRPFFTFMFYESTHAPYNFPPEAIIRSDYLHDVNYARLASRLKNITPLHNRYINAAHFVDAEVGRVFDFLEQQHLLDNTIVLFTGDHGEEFMERGKWGHGHSMSFPKYQVRVPLLLWLPHEPARVVSHPTSHLQIPATILKRLGVTNPPEDYCCANDLFGPQLPYFVVGNHDDMGIIDSDCRIAFPFTSSHFFHYVVKDKEDNPVDRETKKRLIAHEQQNIQQVIAECSRFIQKDIQKGKNLTGKALAKQ